MFKKLVKRKNKGLQWAELRRERRVSRDWGRQQGPWSLEGPGKESGLYHRCQGSHWRIVSTEVT